MGQISGWCAMGLPHRPSRCNQGEALIFFLLILWYIRNDFDVRSQLLDGSVQDSRQPVPSMVGCYLSRLRGRCRWLAVMGRPSTRGIIHIRARAFNVSPRSFVPEFITLLTSGRCTPFLEFFSLFDFLSSVRLLAAPRLDWVLM